MAGEELCKTNGRRIEELSRGLNRLRDEIGRVLIGQKRLVDGVLTGLLTGGHVLLEGRPGLAKTLAIKTLAKCIGGSFSRIQFTPDLLPSDITGYQTYHPELNEFQTSLGPVAANLVLADEINRAPAKVQSALLEAMQERQVTVGGETHSLPQPFLIVATMNPLDRQGTYALPEAQRDRFLLKVQLDYPSRSEELTVMDMESREDEMVACHRILMPDDILEMRSVISQIYVDERLKEYTLDLVIGTRPGQRHTLSEFARSKMTAFPAEKFVDCGASPRASIGLLQAARAQAFLQQRSFVVPEDIRGIAVSVLSHRIMLSIEAEAQRLTPEAVAEMVLELVPVP